MNRPTSHERLYRFLLRLYPAEFRARFGDEMVQLLGDQLRDARAPRTPAGTARTWIGILGDLVVTAASEHARRDRTVAHSLAQSPTIATRALGLIGILGGAVLLMAFVVQIVPELITARLVLFCLGAMAIVIGVHRRQASGGRGLSLAAAIPAVLANAWYAVMVVLSMSRPQPPGGDADFLLVMFFAGVAMWWTDAAFGILVYRLRAASRSGALALVVGSVLAFGGIDRLGLVHGEFGWLIQPLALAGVGLNGLGWILLGIDVGFRRRAPVGTRDEAPAGIS